MVDASSFMKMSERYGVSSVPVTIINGKGSLVGATPEATLLAKVQEVLA